MNIPISDNPTLIAGFSERPHGSMKTHGHTILDGEPYKRRAKFFASFGIFPSHVVSAGLIHGARAEAVGSSLRGLRLEGTDALVTDQKDVYLALTGGDCPPLYLYDPIQEVVALSHCGWKGILAGVVENTIAKMVKEFNCAPQDIKAYVGPGIRSCHFEVEKDVADRFGIPGDAFVKMIEKESPIPGDPEGRWEVKTAYYVELSAAIVDRLWRSGVTGENTDSSGLCTFCAKWFPALKPLPQKSEYTYRFFSFRRDHPPILETQIAVIGMKSGDGALPG